MINTLKVDDSASRPDRQRAFAAPAPPIAVAFPLQGF